MGDDTKRFYLNNVLAHVDTFTQTVELIGNEYNSIARQNRVKNVLNQLRLHKKIDDSQDEAEGLTKAYKIIINLSPQVPRLHTSDAQRIELLCNAVVVCGWATDPPSSVAILVLHLL